MRYPSRIRSAEARYHCAKFSPIGVPGATFGSAGFAHLTPGATFTYASGTLLGASAPPVAGDDVTAQLMSLGDFTPPAASTAFMFAVGGGVEAPVAPHLAAEVGYRLSRVSADSPINAQSVTFGLGYRF